MSKLICSVSKSQLKADGTVAIKEGAIIICQKAYSDKKKCDFYQVFTDNIASESNTMSFGISVEKFNSEFVVLAEIGAIAKNNAEIDNLQKEVESLKAELKSSENKVINLTKKCEEMAKVKTDVSKNDVKGCLDSVGFFRSLDNACGGLQRLEIMLISFNGKMKGSIIVNDMPGYEISGTVSELDKDLIALVAKINDENALVIANINQYSQLLREKEESLRKEAESASKKPVPTKQKSSAAEAKPETKNTGKVEEKAVSVPTMDFDESGTTDESSEGELNTDGNDATNDETW